MKPLLLCSLVLLFAFTSVIHFPAVVAAQQMEHRADAISGGAEASSRTPRAAEFPQLEGSPLRGSMRPFLPGTGFLAYNYDDNSTLTGGYSFIPPDPIGAAGTDRVIAVVNVGIECRNKTGTLLYRSSLKNFFSALGGQTLGTFTFDPKIVYDHYENRFVVVALERLLIANGDPSDDSRILVAVSKTAAPATATSSDWYYMAINSKTLIGSDYYWADYPGFEVDEEAVYITNNMYPFSTGTYGVRLWIINKGVVGGFYGGSTPAWAVYDPIPATFFAMTSMPALVFGAGGAGMNIGTYLVGYSSITTGGPGGTEYVQIIRIDNPLGSPTFTGQFLSVGDLENVGGSYGFPNIPDAPQSGSASLIEVNDARALDAVWRNNELWFTTTIEPNTAYDAVNTGQATAHWFRLDTSAPGSITLADQGNIGGEDIATSTWTFFPSLAVNASGDVMFGFAASASSIYCGAYYAGRHPSDASSTVQAAGVVQTGQDYYLRTFGSGRNRWGDYSGAALDPSDNTTFWIFNEYAAQRGSGTPPEDGRWGTAWRACLVQASTDFGDAPDPTYPTLLATNGARHTIQPGVFLGLLIDAEQDGQPHPSALGDDIMLLADEDGVAFVPPLIPGQPATMNVTASAGGWVDAWIDFNQNGSWLDPGEKVFAGPVAPGVNPLIFFVPVGTLPGPAFARVRYNIGGLVLAPFGPAPDGEVEDYLVTIEEPQEELDFGDAPDAPYPTLLANNGAWHTIVPNVFMGALIDAEFDGQPHIKALGDDIANAPDEDGLAMITQLIPGMGAQVDVVVSVDGWLDIWFDFDQNGSWLDPGELVFSGSVTSGVNQILFGVPQTAKGGVTFARFRYNTTGPLTVYGGAADGEVEDYEVVVEELDFGDAPDPTYPTLLANDGARHVIVSNIYMGGLIDAEPDGQPNPNAKGDDVANLDDEDGVVFTSPIVPGSPATVDVIASAPGFVDAWIDFDSSGTWEASEQIFVSVPVVTGLNNLVFNVPGTGRQAFPTFARFRYSAGGGLQPTGIAHEGEVEDYEVIVEDDDVTGGTGSWVPTHFALHEAVPNPFNPQTKLAFSLPSASHVRLTIYDVNGRLVTTLLNESRGPGRHEVVWRALDDRQRRVASGVYFYRIEAGSFVDTKRMVLVK
ncbi:MAG: T9SS type A sorting domain-containing protein [Candidatus Latescibacterota bacterium]